jgi:Protein of unknown function (DUF3309)
MKRGPPGSLPNVPAAVRVYLLAQIATFPGARNQNGRLALIRQTNSRRRDMLGTILLIILILLLLGAIPAWPYSRGWGYAPGGLISVVLIIVVVLLLTGRI